MVIKIDREQIPRVQLEILNRTVLAFIVPSPQGDATALSYEMWLKTEEGQYHAAQDERPCAYSLS